MTAAAAHTAPCHIDAPVVYLADLEVKPVTYNPPPGTALPHRDGNYRPFTVAMRDGRQVARDLSLDREGFELVRHETAVTDFYDDDEVRRVYYPELEKLL